jgi:hypothetical protein
VNQNRLSRLPKLKNGCETFEEACFRNKPKSALGSIAAIATRLSTQADVHDFLKEYGEVMISERASESARRYFGFAMRKLNDACALIPTTIPAAQNKHFFKQIYSKKVLFCAAGIFTPHSKSIQIKRIHIDAQFHIFRNRERLRFVERGVQMRALFGYD